MDNIKYCPECQKEGVLYKLKLHQINLFEAVYLCEFVKCTYPSRYDCILVKRSLEEMRRQNQLNKTCNKTDGEIDLDSWLNDVCKENGVGENSTTNQEEIARNDEDLKSFLNKLTENFEVADMEKIKGDKTTEETVESNEIEQNVDDLVTSLNSLDVDVTESLPNFNSSLKTYGRKNKFNNLDGLYTKYTGISTGELLKEVLTSTKEDEQNIDYVTPESEDFLLNSEMVINETPRTYKDTYKSVFSIASSYFQESHKTITNQNSSPITSTSLDLNNVCSTSKNQVATNLEGSVIDSIDEDKLLQIKTVYQKDNVKVKLYNSIYDMPLEYQEKIIDNTAQDNFKFKIVPPAQLEKSLEHSLTQNYNPLLKPTKTRPKKANKVAKQVDSPTRNTRILITAEKCQTNPENSPSEDAISKKQEIVLATTTLQQKEPDNSTTKSPRTKSVPQELLEITETPSEELNKPENNENSILKHPSILGIQKLPTLTKSEHPPNEVSATKKKPAMSQVLVLNRTPKQMNSVTKPSETPKKAGKTPVLVIKRNANQNKTDIPPKKTDEKVRNVLVLNRGSNLNKPSDKFSNFKFSTQIVKPPNW